ncbi:MAG: hypothetical protein HY816_16695 [Candidatus Wallbacteria bacterium]|nr:hypothetical protein [Candidatus Wallbacteria bacterium]
MRAILAWVCLIVAVPCCVMATMLGGMWLVENAIGEHPASDSMERDDWSTELMRATGPLGLVSLAAWALMRRERPG